MARGTSRARDCSARLSRGKPRRRLIGRSTLERRARHADLRCRARRQRRVETPFDLASLTKVVATTTVLMDLVRTERRPISTSRSLNFSRSGAAPIAIASPCATCWSTPRGSAPRLIDAPPPSRREFEHDICRMPLEYAPRTSVDLQRSRFHSAGFPRGGSRRRVAARVVRTRHCHWSRADGTRAGAWSSPDFRPLAADQKRARRADAAAGRRFAARPDRSPARCTTTTRPRSAAPPATRGCSAPRLRSAPSRAIVLRAARGERDSPPPFSPELRRAVHDEEHRSRKFARARLGHHAADFVLRDADVARAFGHVGFTGTSLWIDPERDRYFVLLTNRACGGGSLDEMRTVRRAFHDALGDF